MRFGLIGHPLTGSGSPALFSKAYDGRYPYDLIDCASFDEAWARFMAGYQAVNVTAPFKEQAFARVLAEGGSVSEDAAAVGAVNIVVRASGQKGPKMTATPGGNPGLSAKSAKNDGIPVPSESECGLKGYNSDYLGVKAILAEEGFGDGDVALVAGFGGAGKAAAAAAKALGMDVVVCNRTPRENTRPLSELPMLAAVADILIYTLPVAIPELGELSPAGCSAKACGTDASASASSVPTILEANYRTPCLQGVAPHYIPGSRWLLEQARSGYALMTGEQPQI